MKQEEKQTDLSNTVKFQHGFRQGQPQEITGLHA